MTPLIEVFGGCGSKNTHARRFEETQRESPWKRRSLVGKDGVRNPVKAPKCKRRRRPLSKKLN